MSTRDKRGGTSSPGGESPPALTPSSGLGSGRSTPGPMTPLSAQVTPPKPQVTPPEIPGRPRSDRRVSLAANAEGFGSRRDLLMTRPSADFLMSTDLEGPKNRGTFASKVPLMPQVATPTRMGTPRGGVVGTFDDLVRAVEWRPGEGRLVDGQNYSYMVSQRLAQTHNSEGVELTIMDQLQPISGWAKIIKLDVNGNIPEATRSEFNLMFEAASVVRPRLALKTKDALYVLMPEMFGDGLELYRLIEQKTAQNAGDFSAALPVARHTMGALLGELARLHKKDIFHRDIKLDNILFGDDGITALTDFGLAHKGPDLVGIQSTPSYYAPNYFTGDEADPGKLDVFALGATIMALYTGSLPLLTAEANSFFTADQDLKLARYDLEAYRLGQTNTALRTEPLADKQARAESAQEAFVVGLKAYRRAHKAMVEYVHARTAGNEHLPLPDLGREAWTQAFALLVQRDFAVVPLLVAMLAPTDKGRISAKDAWNAWRRNGLQVVEQSTDALAKVYGEYCAPRLKQAQARTSELIDTMRQRLAANSPLFDEPQLENQPIVNSVEEAKQHIVGLATDVYHSLEAVRPGSVSERELRHLAVAKHLIADKSDIDAAALAEVAKQVRDATPPKIEPVSVVRGVKRIRDLSVKVR